MQDPFVPPQRSWPAKFAAAFRGWILGSRGQSSFHVHFVIAVAVVAIAAYAQVTATEWCLLGGCITAVFSAELLNSALENLAKAITDTRNDHVARALDIASGAVLMAGLGSAIIGLVILVPRFWPI